MHNLEDKDMDKDFDDQSIAEKEGTTAGDDGPVGQAAVGNILDSKSVSDFNKQAHDIKESADNGGWAINEDGMNVYRKACNEFLDRYEEMIDKARRLEYRVKLGSSPYAYAIADFNVTVANGDERSLIPNLELMRDGYEKLKAALETAQKSYDENEDSVVQDIEKLNPDT